MTQPADPQSIILAYGTSSKSANGTGQFYMTADQVREMADYNGPSSEEAQP